MQQIQNPYELILNELSQIRQEITFLKSPNCPPTEVIDRKELQARLNVTEPTVITWGKKGKIPEMRIGNSVRYNWPDVVAALSNH